MPDSEYIADLLFRHLRGELKPEEAKELQQWRKAHPANETLYERANDPDTLLSWLQQYHRDKEAIWQKVIARAPELQTITAKKVWWKHPLAAAVLLAIMGTGIYVLFFRQTDTPVETAQTENNIAPDVPAGSVKAILTLANGSQVVLDSGQKSIPLQVNKTVIQSDTGIAYTQQNTEQETNAYNTLTTPRGGQYFVVLSDGTRVWLNAASQLKYPVHFSGKERRVELKGEGYFEVAKNAASPFKVSINETAELTVLGTHFNVMAYTEEEKITASLLEGKVKFQNIELLPGQQAVLNKNGKLQLDKNAEVALSIAWKNGVVEFRNASIPTIMRAIARWYNVDIIYPAQLPERSFTGGIPRNSSLSEVLQVLELYHINTTLKNKTITITP